MKMSRQEPWALFSVLIVLSLFSSALGIYDEFSNLPRGGTLPNGGKIWALLVAGSSGYFNYRHQADVCHAYQILHRNGIPNENIIVMMYDDVATSKDNPTPNVIINRPGGPNVYKGVPIDYSQDDVNSTNFISVLTGQGDAVQDIGTGRVINSGPNDHIFVNFVDHGAPGLLCFPGDELHAKQLEKVLESMVSKKRFSKMVLYIEACESGSMFDDILPDNSNIFVMTAADPRESSFACYYDALRQTYLGDVFSVEWMEDSDVENLAKETLHHQFELVRYRTNTSHVEEYGDLDVGSLPVAHFQGYRGQFSRNLATERKRRPLINDAVPSWDVPLEILKRRYEAATDRKSKRLLHFKIHRMEKLRRHMDVVMSDIADHVTQKDEDRTAHLLNSNGKIKSENLDCYETVVKYFNEKCFKLSKNSYALTKLKVFVNICSAPQASVDSVLKAIDDICVTQMQLTEIF